MEPLKPLSWYRELADPRKRRRHGFFLVEGARAIGLIHSVAPQAICELLCTGETGNLGEYPARLLSEKQFAAISSSKTPQGVAAVVRIPPESALDTLPAEPGDKLLVLEGIQDPGNIGTLVRSAAALGFDGAILSETCADPFSPKVVQSSAGTVLSIWLRRAERYLDLVAELKKRRYFLAAADPRGEPLGSLASRPPLAIMLGSEGNGLSPALLDLADARCAIPMNRSRAESLNVAVSGGIVMYHFGTHRASPHSREPRRKHMP